MLRKMVFLAILLHAGVAVALEQRINLPEVNALGARVTEKVRLLRDEGRGAIVPVTVSFSIRQGRIGVINAIYPRGVTVQQVKKEINRHYRKFAQAVPGSIDDRWAYWHLSDRMEIQLQVTMGGFVEAVYLTAENFD